MSLIDKFGRKFLLYPGEITIFGGEPLAQHSFLFELIHELKPLNITVETSGYEEPTLTIQYPFPSECLPAEYLLFHALRILPILIVLSYRQSKMQMYILRMFQQLTGKSMK